MRIVLMDHSEQYQVIRFPGGELQVRLMGDVIAQLKRIAEGPWEVDILARITKAEQIIELGLLADAIHGVDPRLRLHCHMPYLPYARADRRFTEGDCSGLGTFSMLLCAMGFENIITMDVHSVVAKQLIPNLINVAPDQYIRQAIVGFRIQTNAPAGVVNVLFPDEGARYRYAIPEHLGNNHLNVQCRFLHATKHRDPATGKLSHFQVPDLEGRPTIIIDDICDGGGTFVGIGYTVATQTTLAERPQLGLYVTHGIFSQGLESLTHHFQHIYCVDTYSTVIDPRVTQYNIKFP